MIRNVYNGYGYLAEVENAANSTVHWQAESMDARGNVTHATLQNGVDTFRAYDPATGRVSAISAMNGSGEYLQDLAFTCIPGPGRG